MPDDALGPLMHQPRPRFHHERLNPYLVVSAWANLLRSIYDRNPSADTALYVVALMRAQTITIDRLRNDITARKGDAIMGVALKQWDVEYKQYKRRVDRYLRVVEGVRDGSRSAADLHDEWYLPIFLGDYAAIVGEDEDGIEFSFIPPKGDPPDAYTGAKLYNQVAQAEDALSPSSMLNRVVGWGRAAERELSQSAPGEPSTWGDQFNEWSNAVASAFGDAWPAAKSAGKAIAIGGIAVALVVGGVVVYRKAMEPFERTA